MYITLFMYSEMLYVIVMYLSTFVPTSVSYCGELFVLFALCTDIISITTYVFH